MVDDASAVLDKTDTPAEEVDYSWPFGKRHRRSRRLILALLLLIPVWFGFDGELRAAWWHVRHGFHYDFHEYSYYVPPDAQVWAFGEQIMIVRRPGRVRQIFGTPWYHVFLSYQDETIPLERQFAKEDHAVVAITQRSSSRGIQMADTSLTCFMMTSKAAPRNWMQMKCYRESPGPVPKYGSYPRDAGMFDEIVESAKKK